MADFSEVMATVPELLNRLERFGDGASDDARHFDSKTVTLAQLTLVALQTKYSSHAAELAVVTSERDALRAECDRLRAALIEAATSLESISKMAGREDMESFLDVRGYAGSRARVARIALESK